MSIVVYLLITLLVMPVLVDLGIRGVRNLQSHFLEHHEKRVTGLVLVSLGLLSMFVKFQPIPGVMTWRRAMMSSM